MYSLWVGVARRLVWLEQRGGTAVGGEVSEETGCMWQGHVHPWKAMASLSAGVGGRG